MKLTIASLLTAALAQASGTDDWQAPGPDDLRGPCPMLNTLANHGFLPHDGQGLTQDVVVGGLGEGLNFDPELAALMFKMAIPANPEPNATFFTLDHLNRHNVLEHDASLSRTDAYFGNNHLFNDTVFSTSRAYWTAETLTPEMLANSKLARQLASRAENPTYTFTAEMEEFSIGEVAAPVIVFGDVGQGTVDRELVEYFFENEKLPTELGWKPRESVTLEDVLSVSDMIRNATSLLTGSGEAELKARDLHAGGKRQPGCPYGFS